MSVVCQCGMPSGHSARARLARVGRSARVLDRLSEGFRRPRRISMLCGIGPGARPRGIAMSKPDTFARWVAFVVGSVVVVGGVIWLIVNPGVGAVVFLAIGVFFVLGATGRYLRRGIVTMRVADPDVVVPDKPLRLGEQFSVSYRQGWKRATEVSGIRFELVLRETAQHTTYDSRSGPSTTTHTHDDVAQDFAVAGQRFEPGQVISETCMFRIPEKNGMHTFVATNNRIEWYVMACVEMQRWPDFRWEHELTVLPEFLELTDG